MREVGQVVVREEEEAAESQGEVWAAVGAVMAVELSKQPQSLNTCSGRKGKAQTRHVC